MASSKILYVETSPTQQQATTGNWEIMKGLALTLPPANSDAKVALVILNVPNPYAIGNNYPGANFSINVTGSFAGTVPIACFTYSTQSLPNSSGRMPTTLVARIPLVKGTLALQAVWQSVRQSTVIVDTPCSLSAILGMT